MSSKAEIRACFRPKAETRLDRVWSPLVERLASPLPAVLHRRPPVSGGLGGHAHHKRASRLEVRSMPDPQDTRRLPYARPRLACEPVSDQSRNEAYLQSHRLRFGVPPPLLCVMSAFHRKWIKPLLPRESRLAPARSRVGFQSSLSGLPSAVTSVSTH